MNDAPAPNTQGLPQRLASFVAAIVTIGVVWLVVLPSLARQPGVKSRLDWLDERRIDPSARYYTDLEIIWPMIDHSARESRRASPVMEPENSELDANGR